MAYENLQVMPELDPNKEYTIDELTNYIRNAMTGKNVREALARSMEATNEIATWARDVAQGLIDGAFDAGELATMIESKLNQLEQDYAPKLTSIETEIEDARGGEPNLGGRLNEFSSQLAQNANDLNELGNFVTDTFNEQSDKIPITDFTPPNSITLSEDSNEILTYSNRYTGKSGLPLANFYTTFNFYVVQDDRNYVIIGYKDKTNYVAVEFNKNIIGNVYQFNESGNIVSTLQPFNYDYGKIKIGDNITCELTSDYAKFYVNGIFKFEVALSLLPTGITPRLGLVGTADTITGVADPIARKIRNGLYYNFATSFINISPFAGKVASFLGDSVTFGTGLQTGEKPYPTLLKERLGFKTVNNLGVPGTEISTGGTGGVDKAFVNRRSQIPNDSNYIVVFGGHNDFLHDVELGTPDSTDKATFYGALKLLIGELYGYYPNARIIFFTPIPIYSNSTDNDKIPNAKGYVLKDYVDAIKDTCTIYSVPVVDLNTIAGFYVVNSTIRNKFYVDYVHPNQTGQQRIADVAEQHLIMYK